MQLINLFPLVPEGPEARILFLGDSVTAAGHFVNHIAQHLLAHFPERELSILNLGLPSETVSGLSETEHPFPRPSLIQRLDRVLNESLPDLVIASYGLNDAIYAPFDEQRFAAYQRGMRQLAAAVTRRDVPLALWTPPPFCGTTLGSESTVPDGRPLEDYSFRQPFAGYDAVLERYRHWLLDGGVPEAQVVVDTRAWFDAATPLPGSSDGIHPDERGHAVIAQALLADVFGITLSSPPEQPLDPEVIDWVHRPSVALREECGHTNPGVTADATSSASALKAARAARPALAELLAPQRDAVRTRELDYGTRHEFWFAGREAIVVTPERPHGKWALRTEFFGAFDEVDRELVRRGWTLTFLRLPRLYGSPPAVRVLHRFVQHVCERFDLAERGALIGLSRGGFTALRFATAYPDCVDELYLDAPVVDLRTWPAGGGGAPESPRDVADVLRAYRQSRAELEATDPRSGWIPLAASRIPVILVSGDADSVVPFERNGEVLADFLGQAGSPVEVILKPGGDHHPHGLPDPTRVVEFLERAAS